jgi:hypothetical protein
MKAWIIGAAAAVVGAAIVLASIKKPTQQTTITPGQTTTTPVQQYNNEYNQQSNKYYNTPTSGAGTQAVPFLPSANGLLTWQGNGYYQTSIPDVMGTKSGEYLITNQAFVAAYDANAKILGY